MEATTLWKTRGALSGTCTVNGEGGALAEELGLGDVDVVGGEGPDLKGEGPGDSLAADEGDDGEVAAGGR